MCNLQEHFAKSRLLESFWTSATIQKLYTLQRLHKIGSLQFLILLNPIDSNLKTGVKTESRQNFDHIFFHAAWWAQHSPANLIN
jgi:hypothetical protein